MLAVKNLAVAFGALRAVDEVSFEISRGDTFALVGESGSGKSTMARLVMGLLQPENGEVVFDGQRIDHLDERARRPFRRRMQMVFQDPGGSLNPRRTVRETLCEPFVIHQPGQRDLDEKVLALVSRVGLSGEHLDRYPHEFSGGQRQRISIARALALNPEFIVLDEPTSALDVSVQAQILNLLQDLQRDLGLTYLFISHDIAVVAHLSDHVGVMRQGRLVEVGPADQVLHAPSDPYTRALLDSIPPERPG
ncbi:MAG: ABC transporter ATP-binding protein [Armatimonadetes bacterium]|nr:ABC transporter ATP-binding protein [Armatimonadota bacterium]